MKLLSLRFFVLFLTFSLSGVLLAQNNWQQMQRAEQQRQLQQQMQERQRADQQRRMEEMQRIRAEQQREMQRQREIQIREQQQQQQRMREQQRQQQEQLRQQQRQQQEQVRAQQQQARQQQIAERQRQMQDARTAAQAQQRQQQRQNIASNLVRSRTTAGTAVRQGGAQANEIRREVLKSRSAQEALGRVQWIRLRTQDRDSRVRADAARATQAKSAAIQQQRVQAQGKQASMRLEARKVQAKAQAERVRLVAGQREKLATNGLAQAQTKRIGQSKVIRNLVTEKSRNSVPIARRLSADAKKSVNQHATNHPLLGKQVLGPRLSEELASTFKDRKYTNRKATGEEIFYKYHGVDNRTGKEYNFITTKRYSSEKDFRNGTATLKEWGIKLDRVTTFKPARGTWLSEGFAAKQKGKTGEERPGGDYQAVIDTHNMPNSSVVRTDLLDWDDR